MGVLNFSQSQFICKYFGNEVMGLRMKMKGAVLSGSVGELTWVCC